MRPSVWTWALIAALAAPRAGAQEPGASSRVRVDIDPAMLHEARQHLRDVELVEADMRTFVIGTRFDAVLCLFSSIGYMRSQTDLDAAVANMVDHLQPGGVLIIDGWVRPDAWLDGNSTHIETATTESVKVARVGRENNWYWRERSYSERSGDLGSYRINTYCEYPANFIRIVHRFVLGA